jgi:two-component system, OmpR family, sensor kinase
MRPDRVVPGSWRVPRPFRRLLRGQLRLRVLIAVVSLILVALAGFDVAAVTALRSYLLTQTDTALRIGAQTARPGLTGLRPGGDLGRQMEAWADTHRFISRAYSVEYLPYFGDGDALVDGPPPPRGSCTSIVPTNLPQPMAIGRPATTHSYCGDQLRSLAVQAAGGTLVLSTSLDDVNRTEDRMRLIVLIGSAAAVLVISVGVFWLLRRGLRPIETMATQADRITAGDLTDRVIEQDPRSEVGRLGSALNGMLARIEASVQEREAGQELMRRFFADASHELRTPLASLRANAELYQQGALADRAQVDEVMRRIALEARRMSGLVDDMLRLARLDQHPDQQREFVDLTDLVAGCVDRIRVAAPEHVWCGEIDAGMVVVGDGELLRRAVDNLLANVLAHTPPGTSATVALRDLDGTVAVEVGDTGPGVPPDRLPRIFDRFYRADTTGSRPGSGLGLAIVTQIATVHNGTVVAEPNRPHGLRVRLTLPAADPFARDLPRTP